MKIILLKDGKKLGKKNTIIEVKDGYGTYLIREKIALPATPSNLKKLETEVHKAKELDIATREAATKIKEKLEADKFIIDITYNTKSQQLNGSITKNHVLDIIKSRYTNYDFSSAKFIDFPKTHLAQMYKAKLCLYKDIVAEINFGVEL